MSLLPLILRRMHCRGTHQRFALDSLDHVQTPAGKRLARLLLKYNDRFLTGTVDPDERFCDFQNHCIHVRSGYWGGAPRLAMIWYERLQSHLSVGRFAEAAYAAGVLSHYFTDPLQPLHTAQTDREPLVHRAMELSVYRSYDDILRIWIEGDFKVDFRLGDGDAWLAQALLKGARFANQSYDRLVGSYDLQRGSIDPRTGLTDDAKLTFAVLFGLAITGLAKIWDRAAADACRSIPLPKTGLLLPTTAATVKIVPKRIRAAFHLRREQRAVLKVWDEYSRLGKLVDEIPSECYVKQQVWQVYQREIAWRQRIAKLNDEATAHCNADRQVA